MSYGYGLHREPSVGESTESTPNKPLLFTSWREHGGQGIGVWRRDSPAEDIG